MNTSKRKIIEKSFCLFLSKSYESVSLKEIQEATGISRGAIYHHFENKEEIYEEAIKEYLLPAFVNYSVSSKEDSRNMISTIYASIKHRQSHLSSLNNVTDSKINNYNFFKFLYQAAEHSSNFNEQANLIVEKDFKDWRNCVQNAMRTGEIRSDIDIDFVSQYFLTAPLGLGNLSAFNKYIHTDTNDIRTLYIKFYDLISKKSVF